MYYVSISVNFITAKYDGSKETTTDTRMYLKDAKRTYIITDHNEIGLAPHETTFQR